MTFADLVVGDQVFVDANTFIYHFGSHPTFGPPCQQLMQRIENQELVGFTSTHTLSEVAHRLMLLEASALPGWTLTGARQHLQRQPQAILSLHRFRQAIESVLNSRVNVLAIAPPLIASAAAVSQLTGLLSNDALIIAVMQHHGLTKLASLDSDFDRVPGLPRYTPL